MQEISGFNVLGNVITGEGFNAALGFSRPIGVVDFSNYLNTESDFDIQAENDDDIILDQ